MKKEWTNALLLFSIITFCLPDYAHARGGYGEFIGSLLVTILILLVIFLILREVVCWYWKINETLSVLKQIRDLLASMTPETADEIMQKVDTVDIPYDERMESSEEGDPWQKYKEGYCPECGAKIEKNSPKCGSCSANLIDYRIE